MIIKVDQGINSVKEWDPSVLKKKKIYISREGIEGIMCFHAWYNKEKEKRSARVGGGGKKNGGKKNWLTAEERSWIEQRIGLVRLEFLGGGGGAWSRRGRRFASATSTAPATSARCGVLLLHASPLKTSISVSLKPLNSPSFLLSNGSSWKNV